VWWIVGGALIAVAAARWVARRIHPDVPLERPEQIARAYAMLRRGRPAPIAGAADGVVLFQGKVAAKGTPLVAPISQRTCVFYDVKLDDLRNLETFSEKHPPAGPVPGRRERQGRSFLISDDTATAEVQLDDVEEVSLVVPPHLSLRGQRDQPAAAAAAAAQMFGVVPSSTCVVTEAAIFVGDTVTVTGVGTREPAMDGELTGYRRPPMRCMVRGGLNSVLAILKREDRG
jgi:hypothetical protein